MAAGVITSVGGDVKISTTQVAEITKWSFAAETETKRYASNKTAGKKKTLAGSSSSSGTLTFVYDPYFPIQSQITEGAAVTLFLILGMAGATPTEHKITVPVRIKNLKYDVDIDSGAIIGGTADWESDGVWTYPAAAT